MNEKDETMKDKLIGYGIDIVKSLLIAVVKAKITPKKKEPLDKAEKALEKKLKKSKPKSHILRRLILAGLINELVLNRIQAKVTLKPNSEDFSWLLADPVRNKLVNLNDYVQDLNKNSQVLDLGSGSGYFAIETAKYLRPKGKVFCVDINYEALEKLHDKAVDENISNLEFHRANLENLPFEDNTFEVAFLNMTLGQLRNKKIALREAYRVLKKDGYLIITEILVDPYYCLRSNVISLVNSANFRVVSNHGNFLKYTLVLKKD
jgi:SAM-dependent methyltransferase